MTERYQYIYFEKIEDKAKTSVWSCRNNHSGGELVIVKWYAPWRQYCFFPTVAAVYSSGCLSDIQDFIKKSIDQRDFKPRFGLSYNSKRSAPTSPRPDIKPVAQHCE